MLIRLSQETTLRNAVPHNSFQLAKKKLAKFHFNWTTVTRAAMRSGHVVSWKMVDFVKSKSFNKKVAQVILQADKIS